MVWESNLFYTAKLGFRAQEFQEKWSLGKFLWRKRRKKRGCLTAAKM